MVEISDIIQKAGGPANIIFLGTIVASIPLCFISQYLIHRKNNKKLYKAEISFFSRELNKKERRNLPENYLLFLKSRGLTDMRDRYDPLVRIGSLQQSYSSTRVVG